MIYHCIPDYPKLSGLKSVYHLTQVLRVRQPGAARLDGSGSESLSHGAAVICKLIRGCGQTLITCWLLTGHFSTWSCGSLHRIAHDTALSQNNRGVSVRERG